MEPRRSTIGSPPTALPIDCAALVFARFDSGQALLAGSMMGMRGDRGEGAQWPDGVTWWPLVVLGVQVHRRAAERCHSWLLPARLSSHRSTYG